MLHFLVLTDFSPTADSALRYAVALAEKMNAYITLMYIGEHLTTIQEQAEQLKKLSALKSAFQPVASIHIIIDYGDFTAIVKDFLHSNHTDYIVVGMKGLRSLNTAWIGVKELKTVERFWIGSHTIKVIENVDVPVIVVPLKAVLLPLKHIVLSIDTQKDYNEETFLPLQQIALRHHSHIDIVSIRLRNESKDEEHESLQLRKVKKWIGESVPCSLRIILSEGVYEGLRYYMSQIQKENMLVMVTRKRSFFDKIFGISATQQMVYAAELPVLVLHRK
jgi:nucleotide-binding universal stress UspA family protein